MSGDKALDSLPREGSLCLWSRSAATPLLPKSSSSQIFQETIEPTANIILYFDNTVKEGSPVTEWLRLRSLYSTDRCARARVGPVDYLRK